ncbi:MAG: AMP-binding protein [Lentisphaeria bacterium]|nr:AMP-binding protein [Lentisphaeria bacterium]
MNIICFGDSLTSCGGPGGRYSDLLQELFPRHAFLNRGIGGQTWVDAMERLDRDVLAEHPDIVLLEYGANDWWRQERPPQAWAADLEQAVTRVQAAGAIAVILGVFGPRRNGATGQLQDKSCAFDDRARQYRELEADIARRRGCDYLPNIQQDILDDRCCWRDRNHPNELGNRSVAELVAPVLEKYIGKAARPARPFRPRTLLDFWREAVALAPDRPAAICGATTLTYRQAQQRCAKLAAGLRAAAGADRPKVAVGLPNCLEYYLVYWALVELGGIIVPINPWLKEDSLDAILDTVQPDLLIVQGRADRDILASAGRHPGLPIYALAPEAGLLDFASLEQTGAPTAKATPATEDDAAIIMHTSGTTAAPKGAVMRHGDLIFNVVATINAQGFQPDDTHLLVNPMFHCTALYSSLPAAAYQKTPIVITADTQAGALLRLIQTHRITTFLTVPAILQRVVALPDLGRYDVSSLRVIGYAGSFMPVKTVRQLQAAFPEVALHNFFGLTETISATHVLHGDAFLDRPDSIGRPLPFVTARIVADNGRECGADEVGELLFARENVISGYWGQPERLQEALLELNGRTWFRTGDLASRDSDGFFFIKGRKKDMIIVGGENVFAAEVEAAIMLLADVKEVAVKGIPATGVRESLGELIKAYVVPEPGATLTEADLRRHCHKSLPSYKIPHVVQFLDALPRNPAGKVVKTDLS